MVSVFSDQSERSPVVAWISSEYSYPRTAGEEGHCHLLAGGPGHREAAGLLSQEEEVDGIMKANTSISG